MTDRVTINAGGQLFETTTTTLACSPYFAALFGQTGQSLGHAKKKRRRAAAASPENAVPAVESDAARVVFVDRDPDVFADVLAFLRGARLPAAARSDPSRLADLAAEAGFFGLEGLHAEAEAAIEALCEAVAPPEPPSARAFALRLCVGYPDAEGNDPVSAKKSIALKEGEVLYLHSAVLSGRCRLKRIELSDAEKEEIREAGDDADRWAKNQCYLFTGWQNDTGDFQLFAKLDDPNDNERRAEVNIAHVGMDCSANREEGILQAEFKQDLRVCLDGGRSKKVVLWAQGSATWHLNGWIGHPSAIPPLMAANGGADGSAEARLRKKWADAVASDGADAEERELYLAMMTTATAAAAVASLAVARRRRGPPPLR